MRTAEFFAGIGLVRSALEAEGAAVVWANDIDPAKKAMYVANFGEDGFVLGDVRDVEGSAIPDIDLATASFPCTDLSLAGGRAGLAGKESGLLWEFTRILDEMGARKPPLVLLENVPGLITSNGGKDLVSLIERLNALGYTCDAFVVDARWFVPQSRPRVFVVGALFPFGEPAPFEASPLRPQRLVELAARNPHLVWHPLPLPAPTNKAHELSSIVERLDPADPSWWKGERLEKFLASLSSINQQRLAAMKDADELSWRTAYRRTRQGKAVWEIRSDDIAGCLRASRGGSSKQALVEAGRGKVRVRWLTPREYARLQGAPEDFVIEGVSPNQAYFGFGDAVCVPAVRWVVRTALKPLLERGLACAEKAVS